MTPDLHGEPHRTSAPASSAATGRTAWIIEDDPSFSDLLAHQLGQIGYQSVQHYQGQDAINAARAVRPSLITLDILLPDLGGWDVLRDLKSIPALQRVPVLIISVLDAAQLGEDCGPTAFLRKPASRQDLTDAVTRLAQPSETPARILFVDDDPFMTDIAKAMLRPPRFTVTTASSARAAVEALADDLPDVVLLDLVMPVISGFQLLETLRANPRTRRLPVLALSAKHLSAQEQNNLSQAAQVVLTKSTFTPERLVEKVRRLEQAYSLINPLAITAPRNDVKPMDLDMAQFHGDFVAEARRQLSNLQTALEHYEASGDASAIENAARAAHTLKGAAAMMNYTELRDIAAQAESLFAGTPDQSATLDMQRLKTAHELHQKMERIAAKL